MIPGIVASQMRHAGGVVVGSVSFVSATGTIYTESSTTITAPSSPAAIQNGDGLFAILMARSAVTPPAGWMLVASQAVDGATAQSTYIYRKNTVTTSDSSTAFIWSQAALGRMGLAYITCRSSSGGMVVAETAGAATTAPPGTSNNADSPVLTAGIDGELFLLAVSAVLANTSSASNTWTAPSGATLRTTATQDSNRLAAATQERNAGQTNGGQWTIEFGVETSNELAALTVRVAPA